MTEYTQAELDAAMATATATLELRVNRVRRKALEIADQARPWLDREGQMALDKIVRNQQPTALLVNLGGLLRRDIDRLTALQFHLLRILPLTLRLIMLLVKIVHELNHLTSAHVIFLTKCQQLGIAFGGAQRSVKTGCESSAKGLDV